VYNVQHMREDTIVSLEATARYRPENPYQWGWRQAPSSHLAETILRATDWHQSKSLAVGTQLFSKIEGQIGVGEPICSSCAVSTERTAGVDRITGGMALRPLDITWTAAERSAYCPSSKNAQWAPQSDGRM
jgi:hypothetical protein